MAVVRTLASVLRPLSKEPGTDRVPAEFAAFVAEHEPDLSRALARLTGNGQIAEALRLDLLAAVALRWRSHALRRAGLPARAAYLDRLLRREARAWAPRRAGRDNEPAYNDRLAEPAYPRTAEQAWHRATSMRRRRRITAALIAVAVGLMWTIGPRTTPDAIGPDPAVGPTTIPEGVTVLPPFTHLAGLETITTALPEHIQVNLAGAALLSEQPVARASALLRPELGPLVVLAPDGSIRIVTDTRLLGAKTLTTSLSPGGTRAALPAAEGLLVLEMATGELRSIDVPSARLGVAALAWSTQDTVIVPGIESALEVNVETGAVSALPGLTGLDVMNSTVEASTGLTELLTPTPDADRSRIRIWGEPAPALLIQDRSRPGSTERTVADTQFVDRAVGGPSWLNDWMGAGWISDVLAARNCSSRSIPLPRFVGPARSVVAAVGLSGAYVGTLVAVDTNLLEPVGFADPRRVLVAVHAPQVATMILAWYPHTAQLRRVTTIDTYARVSLANLQAA